MTQILLSRHFYGYFVAGKRKMTQKSHFHVSVSDNQLIVLIINYYQRCSKTILFGRGDF